MSKSNTNKNTNSETPKKRTAFKEGATIWNENAVNRQDDQPAKQEGNWKKAAWFKKSESGFTLIELVLVIAILGVLAVAALPNFFNISLTTARDNAMKATVGSITAGISLYGSNQLAQGNALSFPATLDSAAANTTASGTTPLFGTVLQGGVTAQWFKISGTCYAYDTNGNGTLDSGTDTYFQYNSSANAGTFTQVATCT